MPRRSRGGLVLLALAGALLASFFAGLGVWQVERLAWKLDLVERVEARIHAEPAPAPGRAEWDAVAPATHEYRRVHLSGRFLHERETLVQALTEHGPGFWVLTPLRRDDGETVLVNRGFVPGERRAPLTRSEGLIEGETGVTGLLRITEPGGGFLRANDPDAGRWFSRDVAAIASARGIEAAAPYFVDADATANAGGFPLGGLTVVAFRNHHLVYALTWFALALMVVGGTLYALYDARRRQASNGGAVGASCEAAT